MKLTKQDRVVAALIVIVAILGALVFYGLITDWFGLSSIEQQPDVGAL
ncbi:hypothetical protein [Aurantimonas endophytica]|uniref:Uncharacterized protein n=1 Tax=Aurantimonas endophytica TaxID=1522175 RepID=A0A7W6HGD7_9HYPH|nr:hypothetical protein [Aurantimonas endophytica]MBB4004704.1 hypothetical protein [Aurantimonas endophytica]MCO6405520.1 hypothetical protein [Aurantimonas endophytica]